MTILSGKWSPYLWWTSWSPDGSALLAADADAPETVLARDPKGVTRHILKGHEAGVNAAAWAPDGSLIATSAWDGTVRLWSAQGKACGCLLVVPGGSVECVAWSPCSRRLAAACSDGRLALLEVAPLAAAPLTIEREWDFPGELFSVAWHPRDDMITAAGEHGWSHVPVAGGGGPITRAAGASVVEAAWRPDGAAAVVSCEDGSIWLDDAKDNAGAKPTLVFKAEAPARSLAWHPAGFLAISDAAGWVRVMAPEGEHLWSRRMSRKVVASVGGRVRAPASSLALAVLRQSWSMCHCGPKLMGLRGDDNLGWEKGSGWAPWSGRRGVLARSTSNPGSGR